MFERNDKKREFEDWLEYDLLAFKTKLSLLAHDCHNVDLGKSINEAREELAASQINMKKIQRRISRGKEPRGTKTH